MLVIDGRERTLTLSLHGNVSLADAREFTSLAWSIYGDPAAAPAACGGPETWQPTQLTWAEKRADYPLDPAATELAVSVSAVKDGADVELFDSDLILRVRRDPNDAGAVAVCWTEAFVVT